MRYKPTILIDLDGVLNTYKGNYMEDFIPPIKDGAFEFLKNIYGTYKLILFTTRDMNAAQKWINDNKLDDFFDGITNTKIPAYLTIDDRCVCFKGDFDVLQNDINKFSAWYKN